MEHTPGPQAATHGEALTVWQRHSIEYKGHYACAFDVANAILRLEQQCADLLEALKAFRHAFDSDLDIKGGFVATMLLGDAIEKAKAAIAKAEEGIDSTAEYVRDEDGLREVEAREADEAWHKGNSESRDRQIDGGL